MRSTLTVVMAPSMVQIATRQARATALKVT
jgi:hypothetical protein